MFKSAERKRSQGFTLAEVLIVVAIIGILLAVAIPNVISYYRSLKLTELDDSARSIFMAAQNRLTAMKSAGEDLYALSTVEVNEKPDPGVGTGRFLAVTSEQADSLASIVPGGSIESQLHDNHYVVEIDAKTGAVYAVWYWEKEDFNYQSESYGAVKPAKSDRLEAGRMVGYYGGSFIDRPTIGQTPMPSAQVINAEELALNITVSGDGFTGTPPSIKATITLINGSVECVIVSDASLKYDPFENVFTGRVALDTLDDSKYTLANNANNFESGDMGKSFKDWVYDTMTLSRLIAPGANFDIEVKISAVDAPGSTDPVSYLPQYIYWTGINSLFESVDGGTAKIAYGRHLQNLDTATSGVNETSTTITAAVQTRSIDFNDGTSVTGVYSWAVTYPSKNFEPINNSALATFNGADKTIKNLSVNKSGAGTATVAGLFGSFGDGTDKEISNVTLINAKVSGDGFVGALIGETTTNHVTVSGCKVYLENYTVPATIAPYIESNGSVAGGLIGSAGSDVTISKSSASTVVSGSTSTGGLVGSVNSGITLSIGQSYAASYLSGGSLAGGLIGHVESGGAGSISVSDSYAAGIIESATSAAAGISPEVAPTMSIDRVYAAVRYVETGIGTGATVYGVAPSVATGTEAYYVKQTGVNYIGYGTGVSMSTLKGKIGTVPFDSDEWYNPGTGVTVNPQGLTVPYNMIDGIKLNDPYPYPMLASDITAVGSTATLPMPHYGDWVEDNANTLLVYYEKYSDNIYGFYAAETKDGTTTSVILNTLKAGTPGKDDNPIVVDDGYRIVSINEVTDYTIDETIKPNGTDPNYILVKDEVLANAFGDAIKNGLSVDGFENDSTIYAYKFDTKESIKDYYSLLEVGSQKFLYNPLFACETFDVTEWTWTTPDTQTKLSKPEAAGKAVGTGAVGQFKDGSVAGGDLIEVGKTTGVVIRSARHEGFMVRYTNETGLTGESWQYVQVLDVDYEKYTGRIMNGSGKDKDGNNVSQSAAKLNSGKYYGNDFAIKNVYVSGSLVGGESMGFFGVVKGDSVLDGIRLVNASVSASGSTNLGGLVGLLDDKSEVNDCGIYVESREKGEGAGRQHCYLIYAVSDIECVEYSSVGGLIGKMNSPDASATNSFAAVKVYRGRTGATTTIQCYVGGFAGVLKGTVENCYSGGFTDGVGYRKDSVNVSTNAGYVGGFVGSVDSVDPKFKGINYSTCSVGAQYMSAANCGRFAGKGDVEAEVGGTLYATGKAFVLSSTDVGTCREEANVKTGSMIPMATGGTIKAIPYDDTLGEVYPFVSGNDEHHGDWVVAPKMAYVEKYTDSSYGIYIGSVDESGNTTAENHLDTTGKMVIDDYYAIVSSQEVTGLPPEFDSTKQEITLTSGEHYYAYRLSAPKHSEDGNYYTVFTFNGSTFYYNSALAGEAFDVTAWTGKSPAKALEKPGIEDKDHHTAGANGVVRSARQLAQLGIDTNDGTDHAKTMSGMNYVQLADIDFIEYDKAAMPEIKDNSGVTTYKHVPVRLEGKSATDTAGYDGNGHTVKNMTPGAVVDTLSSSGGSALAENGMFSRVKYANISNVTLINATVVIKDGNSAVMENTTSTTTEPGGGGSEGGGGTGGEGGGTGGEGGGDDVMTAGTYTLDAATSSIATGDETTVEKFTIKPCKFGEKEATFSSPATETLKKYFNLGGGIKTDGTDTIKFTVSGPAKVHIWWSYTSGPRYIVIQKKEQLGVNNNKDFVAITTETTTDEKVGIYSELSISEAGTYYLGSQNSGVRIYKVEVVVEDTTPSGDPGVSEGPGIGGGEPRTTALTGGNTPTGVAMPSGTKVRAGALAGIVDNSTVTNCGVYVDYTGYDPTGKQPDAYDYYIVENGFGEDDYVGGLIGNVTGSTVSGSYSAVQVTGVTYVGGFAGRLDKSTVDGCYSGGHTDGGTYYTENTSTHKKTEPMTNVMATSGTNTGVGGFAGLVSKNGTVTFKGTNYTTCSVGLKNSAKVTEVLNAKNSSAENDPKVNHVETGTSIGVFIGRVEYVDGDTNIVVNDAINYATGTLFVNSKAVKRNDTASTQDGYRWESSKWTKATSDKKASVQYVTADEKYTNALVTMLDPRAGVEDQHYDNSLGVTYPYMAAQVAGGTAELVHHGDWTNRLDFIYYEVYDRNVNIDENTSETVLADHINNGKIGFYGVLRGQASPINTLKKDGVVYDSGYMVVSNADIGPVDIQLRTEYTKAGENNTNHYNQAMLMESKNVSGTDISGWANYVYIVPFSVLNIAPSDHYYMLAFVNGVTYVFNPHFAGEAINVDLLKDGDVKSKTIDLDTVRVKAGLGLADASGEHTDVKGVAIRTAWNFSSISRHCRPSNNGKTQELIQKQKIYQFMDLDYSKDTGYRYGRTYDGNENNRFEAAEGRINVSGTSHAFGHAPAILNGGHYYGNEHTIKNIYLANDSGSNNNYVGMFVLNDGSTVEKLDLVNIHVNAAKVSSGSDPYVYVGGIAALVDGGSRISNVTVTNIEFDFHKIPTYDTTEEKWSYPSNCAPVKNVGGAVGLLKNGAVEGVHIYGVKMKFDGSGENYYKVKDGTNYTIEVLAGKSGSLDNKKAPSAIDENNPINIGGAIGEIDASTATVALVSGDMVLVKDVEVVNPGINANNKIDDKDKEGNSLSGDMVGGVIGKADGGNYDSSADPSRTITIENAGVYVDYTKYPGAADNSAAYDKFTVKANGQGKGDLTGGFAGRTDPFVKLVNCFAAVKVTGGDYAGGFAGDIDGSHIKDCYSGGHTEGGDYPAEANVTGSGHVGGFAGRIQKPKALALEGILYSTCSVSNTDASSENIGVFQGTKENVGSVANTVSKANGAAPGSVTLYATGKVISGGPALQETYLSPAQITAPTSAKADATTTKYDPTLGNTYPYQAAKGQTVHHGDWLVPDIAGVFYWEKEQVYSWSGSSWEKTGEPAYNYHLMGVSELSEKTDKALDVNTLCTEHHDDGKIHQIDCYGYGVLTTGDGAQTREWGGFDLGMEDPFTSLDSDESEVKALIEKELGTFTSYFGVYQCDKELSHEYNQYKYNLSIPGAPIRTVYFTIDFADLYLTEKHNDNNTFTIRAARQLDNIIANTPNTYEQAHDVGAVGYKDYTPTDIASSTYNGQHYRILELNIVRENEDVGLFRISRGATVKNTILYSPSGTAKIEATGNYWKSVGGLIAYVADERTTNNVHYQHTTTIDYCVVAGYTLSSTRNTVGGLVGDASNNLTITNSEAVNTLVHGNSRSDSDYETNPETKTNERARLMGIGGLVGRLNYFESIKLTITNCYAGGKVTGVKTATGDGWNANVGGLFGGYTNQGGEFQSNTIKITGSYSYLDMRNAQNYNDVYTVGPDFSSGSNDFYYLKYAGYPDSDGRGWHLQGSGCDTIEALKGNVNNDGSQSASAYVPGLPDGSLLPQENAYTLRGVVKNASGKKLFHYGELPGATSGDPGNPEGPSFEGAIAPAGTEIVVPAADDPAPADGEGAAEPTASAPEEAALPPEPPKTDPPEEP